ncbi:histidine phosphatase family protein [Hydrogenophaga sp. SL48]|uniref:histidine phosphatase family protein n=1 Tax=Hydrogenophaga sp. SL48 TaxID=2806347 RepID=UPI001F1EDC3D|nr:histidine phosphatase family protein [Hydrogenophaga sp. SL48]UJW80953.1 histidine phosphatase family protein [Hydrogenophaga sp. SL48]
MALTLLMARHGQTDLNIDERWQGRLDMPLNATGVAQAEQLALSLPGGIDALVVSPMLRARQTAEPVTRALGLVPRLDADFRERDFGIFEGITADDAVRQYPELAARNVAYRWDEAPPGAELTRAVVDRVERGLQLLRAMHDGQTVLLVSHGFVVRCLRYLIDGLSDAAFFEAERIPNGAFLTRQLP